MSFTLADFGFDLSNREIAIVIYLGLALVAVLLWKNVRPLAFNLVRAFFAPRLALVWLLMSLYVACCVWFLASLNLWEWSNLKSTLVWWLTVGFTSIHEAERLKKNPHLLRKLVRETFTISAAIWFIAELVSFPLLVELLFVLVLVVLTVFITVAEKEAEKPGGKQVLRLLQGLQAFLVFIVLSFSYWRVANNVTEFWSLNTLREFGIPILLWLMFIPFIYFLAVYMAYEDIFVRLNLRPKQAPIVAYARWRAAFAFGWDIEGLKRLARDMRGRDIASKEGVRDAIREIKRLRKIEKNPPEISRAEGWSPYDARLFLKEYGLVPDDYHRTPWGWIAHAPSIELSDEMRADKISYHLTGNERSVTRMRIALDGSKQNDTNEARHAFDERALTLLAKAFDSDRAGAIYASAQAAEPNHCVADGVRVSLEQSDWGDARFGGYEKSLIIRHPNHQEDD